jgi:hypothetical protein
MATACTVPRPGIFRRPTNLSEKAGKKGGPPSLVTDSRGNLIEAFNDHINLEGGLDITLNCEVSQGDPAGITTAYRLLVPALWYDGSSDSQKLDGPQAKAVGGLQRKPTLLRKLGFGRMGNRSLADRQVREIGVKLILVRVRMGVLVAVMVRQMMTSTTTMRKRRLAAAR